MTVADVAAPVEAPAARFLLFRGADHGWVLRDQLAGRDFPFYSREAAVVGAQKRATIFAELIGSPSSANVYGAPLESVEEIA